MLTLFRRKAVPAPISLADHAVSTVGLHDARRAKSLENLRQMEKRLDANIRREMEALSAVRAAISREEAADATMAIEAASADIEAAMEEIGLEVPVLDYDPAEDARRSYDVAVEAKRARGDKHWPQRASETTELAAAE